jgi:hypothetical protein
MGDNEKGRLANQGTCFVKVQGLRPLPQASSETFHPQLRFMKGILRCKNNLQTVIKIAKKKGVRVNTVLLQTDCMF